MIESVQMKTEPAVATVAEETKTISAETAAPVAEERQHETRSEPESALSKHQTHAPTLDCERCFEAHIGFAAVLAQEVSEDGGRTVERRLALGNLKAAEWHARALGKTELAERIRAARHKFAESDDASAVAELLSSEI